MQPWGGKGTSRTPGHARPSALPPQPPSSLNCARSSAAAHARVIAGATGSQGGACRFASGCAADVDGGCAQPQTNRHHHPSRRTTGVCHLHAGHAHRAKSYRQVRSPTVTSANICRTVDSAAPGADGTRAPPSTAVAESLQRLQLATTALAGTQACVVSAQLRAPLHLRS